MGCDASKTAAEPAVEHVCCDAEAGHGPACERKVWTAGSPRPRCAHPGCQYVVHSQQGHDHCCNRCRNHTAAVEATLRCAREGCPYQKHPTQGHGFCCNNCKDFSHGPACEKKPWKKGSPRRKCARPGCNYMVHSTQGHDFCCNRCRTQDHGTQCQRIAWKGAAAAKEPAKAPSKEPANEPAKPAFVIPEPSPKADGPASWDDESAKAAQSFLSALELLLGENLSARAVSEAVLVLKSRDACRAGGGCSAERPCRFRHGPEDEPLIPDACCVRLDDPDAHGRGEKRLPRAGLAWFLLGDAYGRLGPEAFADACAHQAAALLHFSTRQGARMVCQGLPEPDELQAFALRKVKEIWGDVVNRCSCQEYLDRSSQRTKSTITGGDYSAPSRRPVKLFDGPQGTIDIARIVKVALNNPNADFTAKRDTAWHGCQARSLEQWRPSKPNTHPQFQLGKFKHTAHGAGIYVTPAFEHAVGYAFRMWNRSPRFAVMQTKSGKRWNYCTIMQLAIYDRGVKGVVDEQRKTWGGLPSDGWDDSGLEWVVRDASKAQIYGLLFCFFPNDPPQGG